MMMMTTQTTTAATATVKLKSVDAERGTIEVTIPGTDYRLKLSLDAEPGALAERIGKRIRGTIHAQAQRIHPSKGGGRFIEPVWGEPRIVAGFVMNADPDTRQVIIDAAVPMNIIAPAKQDFSVVRPGHLINMHVESGAVFRPAAD